MRHAQINSFPFGHMESGAPPIQFNLQTTRRTAVGSRGRVVGFAGRRSGDRAACGRGRTRLSSRRAADYDWSRPIALGRSGRRSARWDAWGPPEAGRVDSGVWTLPMVEVSPWNENACAIVGRNCILMWRVSNDFWILYCIVIWQWSVTENSSIKPFLT